MVSPQRLLATSFLRCLTVTALLASVMAIALGSLVTSASAAPTNTCGSKLSPLCPSALSA